MPAAPPLFFVPPCGAVTVERAGPFGEEDEEDADADTGFRCCKSIDPAAREIPTLDRRGGRERRRKAEENSLKAGNEEVRESEAVLRMRIGLEGRNLYSYTRLVEGEWEKYR